MPDEQTIQPTAEASVDKKAEKKRLKDERSQLKKEQKEQKKEAKRRAKEIAAQEAELTDDEEAGGIPVFIITVVIVMIWLAILALLIKLDVGGFGSGVLAPVLSDVPVINKILPEDTSVETTNPETYGGYSSLQQAVETIKELELELQAEQEKDADYAAQIAQLEAEVERLSTFEERQQEFERIKNEFYEEVVYAENGPGAEAYQKYFEAMDPATAEYLYKQVIAEQQADELVSDYAAAYSAMKPKEAAAIFEAMTDDLELAAKILNAMSSEDRGAILGAMNADVAAMLTKIMDPE